MQALIVGTIISGLLSFKASMDQASALEMQADLRRKQGQMQARTELLRIEQQQISDKNREIAELDQAVRRKRAAATATQSAMAALTARGVMLGSGSFDAILRENHRALREDLQMLNLASITAEQESTTSQLGYAMAGESAITAGNAMGAAAELQAGAAQIQGFSTLINTGMDAYAIS